MGLIFNSSVYFTPQYQVHRGRHWPKFHCSVFHLETNTKWRPTITVNLTIFYCRFVQHVSACTEAIIRSHVKTFVRKNKCITKKLFKKKNELCIEIKFSAAIQVFMRFRKICEERLLASSCLSVRPNGTTRPPLDGFSWNLIFEFFSRNSVEIIQLINNNIGYFTWRPIYIFDHISLISS